MTNRLRLWTSVLAYCKQSQTGLWEDLGTRLGTRLNCWSKKKKKKKKKNQALTIFICWLRWCSYVVIHVVTYSRSGNFHVKNNSHEKFSCYYIFAVSFNLRNFCNNRWLQYGQVHGEFLDLVYYQVSGVPGITGCSRRSDIYLGECGLARASFTDHCRVILFFCALNFHSWSRLQNDFNSEIFPIYSTCTIRTWVVWLVETTHK